VGRSGAIYEGRALNVRGAHVEGHNTGSVGICLLGDYRWQFPSESQIYATRCLIRWLSFGLNLTYLAGHCDLNDGTVCPGNNLVPYLAALADRAGLMPGAGAA
jgi:N-acetyl-anhydromuramyl-L-alanine amidase AmpD